MFPVHFVASGRAGITCLEKEKNTLCNGDAGGRTAREIKSVIWWCWCARLYVLLQHVHVVWHLNSPLRTVQRRSDRPPVCCMLVAQPSSSTAARSAGKPGLGWAQETSSAEEGSRRSWPSRWCALAGSARPVDQTFCWAVNAATSEWLFSYNIEQRAGLCTFSVFALLEGAGPNSELILWTVSCGLWNANNAISQLMSCIGFGTKQHDLSARRRC